MNRHERRSLGLAGAEQSRAAVGYFVARLSAEGASLREALQNAVEGDVRPGHVADALTNAAAEVEQALACGQMERAATAIVATLYYARALAFAADKLHEPAAAAQSEPTN
jgi:hypothetical protein